LANIYLHHAYDQWVNQWRKRHAQGDMIVVRYADDSVTGFRYRRDAEKFLADLQTRLAKFSLSLHPEKTRLIEFGKYAAERRGNRGLGKPETFDFLGMTHICGKKKDGKGFQLLRKTARKRMKTKLREIKEEMRRHMHATVDEQGRWLGQVMRGYFAYYAVPTNGAALSAFRHHVIVRWLRVLRRRSQRGRITWKKMQRYVDLDLPKARILHPWPDERFRVKYSR
jgi:RNA-directed DNA polymerase